MWAGCWHRHGLFEHDVSFVELSSKKISTDNAVMSQVSVPYNSVSSADQDGKTKPLGDSCSSLAIFMWFSFAWNSEEENQEDLRLLEWQPKNQWLTMNMQCGNYALLTSSPWNIPNSKVEIGTRKRVSNEIHFTSLLTIIWGLKNVVQWSIGLVHYSAVTYVFLSWPLLSVPPSPNSIPH